MASLPSSAIDYETEEHISWRFDIETVAPKRSNNNGGDHDHEEMGDAICLTWKNLWVTVSKGRNGNCRPILEDLTGYAKPGQLLAIMGPSGCGKSTLLDALAGRLGSNTRQVGDILINGHKQALAYGTSAYVTQDDALLTTLTVREAVYYSAQLQLPNTMSSSEKKERADFTIMEMGLQDAMNTKIGGWGSKGISGEQKRRVSICIEILTHPRLLFLDEPTSGLDSAASCHVISRIASLNQKDGIPRTIIASIHQPSSEVFQRERLNGHYGVSAFVFGNTFSSFPYLLVVSVIPGAITYYLPGLQKGHEHFIYFLCVLFSSLMLVESINMIIASLVPNFLMGTIAGAGIQGIMILSGGFFRRPNDLPGPFWRYPLSYVAFHRYAFQGLFKNEFEGLSFAGNQGGKYIEGEEILRNTWQVDMGYSNWIDVVILVRMIVLYRVLFFVIKTKEKVKPIVASIFSMSPKQTIQIMENPNAPLPTEMA